MAVESTGGQLRGGGPPRTWRDDLGTDAGHDFDLRPGYRRSGRKPPVRMIPRRRRSPAPGILVPSWLSGQVIRQILYAGVILVLAAAAFRLPFDLGARLQAAAAAALSRDVDLEAAGTAVREAVQRGRAWVAGTMQAGDGVLPAAGDTPAAEPASWMWPVAGPAVAGFGWRDDGAGGTVLHEGLDIAAAAGTPVVAAAAGTVTHVGPEGGDGGSVVEIDHGGGWISRYGHLAEAYVAAGDIVLQGDVIATLGTPGDGDRPHLHFELRHEGTPVDPEPKLRRDDGPS